MMNRGKLKPYDSSLDDKMLIYDCVPYVRNVTICGKENIRLYSGNVFKYYSYTKLADEKIIPNQDDVMETRIALLKENAKRQVSLQSITNKSERIKEDEE